VFTRPDGSSYEVNDAVARCIEHRELPGVEVVRLSVAVNATLASKPGRPKVQVQGWPRLAGPRLTFAPLRLGRLLAACLERLGMPAEALLDAPRAGERDKWTGEFLDGLVARGPT
jgi:hypothetical protein